MTTRTRGLLPPHRSSPSPRATELSRASQAAFAACLVVATVLAGCATAAAPSASAEQSQSASPHATPSERATPSEPPPTPTSTPIPSPTPIAASTGTFSLLPADPPPDFVSTITCDGSIGPSDPVAIVQLKSSDPSVATSQVLRDYSDISAPGTVCDFGDIRVADLIDARHVLIGSGALHAVVDLPEVQYHWFGLPEVEGGNATLWAVSPQLDAVVWMRYRADPLTRELVMTTDAGDAVVANLPGIEGGRCGSAVDSNFADYQSSGRHYYALDQLIASVNALVVAEAADAKLEIVPPDGGWGDPASIPMFAVWSPVAEVLYYRLGSDVMRWTPETGPELFLADSPWFHPSMTSDGRYLAYVVDSDLYLIDFKADATPRLIHANVLRPVFLNSAQLWFEELSQAGCITEERDVRVYDVRDGSVAPSIVDSVFEVWPQTSSNH